MQNGGLGLYALMSKAGFPKSYPGKVLLVAFLGVLAAPLAVSLYLLLGYSSGPGEALRVLAFLAVAVLAGMAATLIALRALLAPLGLASAALEEYLEDRTRPELSTGFDDEAGRLVAAVRRAVEHLDSTITSLDGLSGLDHLTGLPNRRRGEERLAEDFARARRGDADAGSGGRQRVQDHKRHPRPPGRRRLHPSRGVAHAGQRQGGRLAGPVGRGRVRPGVVGFLRVRLARDGAGKDQPRPEGEPGATAGSRGVGPERERGGCRYAGEEDVRELLAKADAAMYGAKREGRAWVLVE